MGRKSRFWGCSRWNMHVSLLRINRDGRRWSICVLTAARGLIARSLSWCTRLTFAELIQPHGDIPPSSGGVITSRRSICKINGLAHLAWIDSKACRQLRWLYKGIRNLIDHMPLGQTVGLTDWLVGWGQMRIPLADGLILVRLLLLSLERLFIFCMGECV